MRVCAMFKAWFVFQSTLPMKGATLLLQEHGYLGGKFQSTLPMKGATPTKSSICAYVWFQSTLPMKGATNLERGCFG